MAVRGEPIAAVTAANELLYCGSADEGGMRTLVGAVDRGWFRHDRLSLAPLRLRDGKWTPLELEARHPLAPRLRALRVRARASDYAVQQQAIYDHPRAAPPTRYIASVLLTEDRESGGPMTACTWEASEPTLLPRTDWVALGRVSADRSAVALLACGRWDRVRDVLGDRLTPAGGSPELYATGDFPTEEQLQAIGLDKRFLRPRGSTTVRCD
jgi:hypothetical protein